MRMYLEIAGRLSIFSQAFGMARNSVHVFPYIAM